MPRLFPFLLCVLPPWPRGSNIDRLAGEGVELDRFYVCPVCSPTRSGMMTGRYAIRFGMQCAG